MNIMGCNGGMPDSALKFMINNEQCNENDYPYVSGASKTAGKCHTCESADVAFSACYDITPNDQLALHHFASKMRNQHHLPHS